MTTNSSPTLPFILAMTEPSVIKEGTEKTHYIYDPIKDMIQIDMRSVGTKCLKVSTTYKKNGNFGGPDRKNEIDDSKTVK